MWVGSGELSDYVTFDSTISVLLLSGMFTHQDGPPKLLLKLFSLSDGDSCAERLSTWLLGILEPILKSLEKIPRNDGQKIQPFMFSRSHMIHVFFNSLSWELIKLQEFD